MLRCNFNDAVNGSNAAANTTRQREWVCASYEFCTCGVRDWGSWTSTRGRRLGLVEGLCPGCVFPPSLPGRTWSWIGGYEACRRRYKLQRYLGPPGDMRAKSARKPHRAIAPAAGAVWHSDPTPRGRFCCCCCCWCCWGEGVGWDHILGPQPVPQSVATGDAQSRCAKRTQRGDMGANQRPPPAPETRGREGGMEAIELQRSKRCCWQP